MAYRYTFMAKYVLECFDRAISRFPSMWPGKWVDERMDLELKTDFEHVKGSYAKSSHYQYGFIAIRLGSHVHTLRPALQSRQLLPLAISSPEKVCKLHVQLTFRSSMIITSSLRCSPPPDIHPCTLKCLLPSNRQLVMTLLVGFDSLNQGRSTETVASRNIANRAE